MAYKTICIISRTKTRIDGKLALLWDFFNAFESTKIKYLNRRVN